MPSAAELQDGDLVLRPWRDDDVDAIGYTLRSPEIGYAHFKDGETTAARFVWP